MQQEVVKTQDLIKKQKVSGILINLDLKTSLIKITLLGEILV